MIDGAPAATGARSACQTRRGRPNIPAGMVSRTAWSIPHGTVSRTAWSIPHGMVNPARHGTPHGTVPHSAWESRTARYPTRHGIPHGTASRTGMVPRTARYPARHGNPARHGTLHGTVHKVLVEPFLSPWTAAAHFASASESKPTSFAQRPAPAASTASRQRKCYIWGPFVYVCARNV